MNSLDINTELARYTLLASLSYHFTNLVLFNNPL